MVCVIVGLAMTPTPAKAQDCPAAVEQLLADGWSAYRRDDFSRADTLFRRASAICPQDIGVITGLGYAAMRLGRTEEARSLFARVLAVDSSVVDALVGIALVSWLNGELEVARDGFARVLRVEPENVTALQYLRQMPESGPSRPPLLLPGTLEHRIRASRDRFEVRTADGWRPFYVKGVNLGAALPGRFPSQFPDSATYASWLTGIGEMGANTIRVYTIHPPEFYDALRAYNLANPDDPLWVVHGVWTELPPNHEYEDPTWEGEFFREMRRVVDVIHGRADIFPRRGHAAGRYIADVSDWTLAYIIGREWEPYSVVVFNRRGPRQTEWSGRYIELRDGSPMETWLAKACEQIVAYESETYRKQRPVAYTNWPTLDPMYHPTETTAEEEVAIRRALGEQFAPQPMEYDNDGVGLDAGRMRPTAALPAGVFAAFHVYPYYPDFMVLDARYAATQSAEGPSAYYGYLRDLKAHHPTMPVLIAEYGVPASLGVAHVQPQGWHHGGHTEARMAEIDGRLTREIAEAGMAGGIVFSWIDEWFKKNWITVDFEIPQERGRLWHNRLDAEQHYGMVAMDAAPRLAGETLAQRMSAWGLVPPLYRSDDGARLRASADEEALWVLFDPGRRSYERVFIGFDMVDPKSGDFRWPGGEGPRIPVGIEFVLDVSSSGVRLLADSMSNLFRLQSVRDTVTDEHFVTPTIEQAPPGFFTGRVEQRFRPRYVTEPNEDGRYDSLRVVVNRPRFGRDGREYAGMGYDRGILREGPPPDGVWERLERGVVEIRIPWALLNVTDPSERRVLQHDPETARGALGTTVVRSIGIVAGGRDARGWWSFWPAPANVESVARYSWPTWETPQWRSRRRPAYEEMRRTFRSLEPTVVKYR